MNESNNFNIEASIFQLENSKWVDNFEKTHTFVKNQIIYRQGDNADYVYYLKSGKVQIYINSEASSEKVLTTVQKRNLFGIASFFEKTPRASSARALQKAEVFLISRKAISKIIGKHPEFALDIIQNMSETIRMLSTQINNITLPQADKRIASYLANQASIGADGKIPCTHDEISGIIGVSRVTVSKTLSKFVRNGWIVTKYKEIIITNLSALSEFAYS